MGQARSRQREQVDRGSTARIYEGLLLLTLAGSILLYVPGWYDPLVQPKLLWAVLGSLVLFSFPYPITKEPRPVLSRLIVPAASFALILLACLSGLVNDIPLFTALFGYYGRSSGLLLLLAYVLILNLAGRLSPTRVPLVLDGMLAIAAVAAAIGLRQHLLGVTIPGTAPSPIPALTSTFGNSNFAAAFFAMSAVLAFGMAAGRGVSVVRRVVYLSGFFVLGLCCWWTGTTQGWISLAAGVAAVANLQLWRAARGRGPLFRALVLLALLTALGTAAALLAGWGPQPAIWEIRNIQIRSHYWAGALEMIRAHPIWGVGPDNFAGVISRFRDLDYIQMVGPFYQVSAAHNVFLQVGATLGLPALLLWMLLLLSGPALLLYQILKARLEKGLLTPATAILAALLAYLAQGMVNIDQISLLTTAALMSGLAYVLAGPALESSLPAPWELRLGRWVENLRLPVGFLLAAGILISGINTVGTANRAVAVLQGRSTTPVTILQDLRTLMVSPYLPCALRGRVSNAVAQADFSSKTAEALSAALKADPYCGEVLKATAQFSAQTLQPDAADVMDRFTRYDPLNFAVWQLHSQWAAALRNQPLQLESARRALDLARATPGEPARRAVKALEEQVAELQNTPFSP